MKIAITTFGVPNLESAQANADPLLYALRLKKKHRVNFFVISNDIFYQTNKKENYYKNQIEKKYGLKVNLIKLKKYNFFYKIINKFLNLDPFWQYQDKENIFKKKIEEYNADLIFNFLDRAITVTKNINIKKVNYLGVPLNLVENYRQKFFLPFSIIKKINSWIFLIKFNRIKKKIYNQASLNFCLCSQCYNEYKPYVKNLKLTQPLSIKKTKNVIDKNNKITKILMIGNLRSSFVHDGLVQLVSMRKDFEKIYHQKKFIITIVGAFRTQKKIYDKLKAYKWIKFVGWKKNVNSFLKDSDFLLVLNINKLGVRTKILDALSSGLPVLTYKNNIYFDSKFKDKENMLIAKNQIEIIKKFQLLLTNKKLKKKIHKNSFNLYKNYYDVNKIIYKNQKIIEHKINI